MEKRNTFAVHNILYSIHILHFMTRIYPKWACFIRVIITERLINFLFLIYGKTSVIMKFNVCYI